MKKVIRFLPVMAILLGSGLALATTKPTMAPQYYKNNTTGEWRSLTEDGIVLGDESGQYSCAPLPGQCTAEGFDHLGNPIGLVLGVLTQNP